MQDVPRIITPCNLCCIVRELKSSRAKLSQLSIHEVQDTRKKVCTIDTSVVLPPMTAIPEVQHPVSR